MSWPTASVPVRLLSFTRRLLTQWMDLATTTHVWIGLIWSIRGSRQSLPEMENLISRGVVYRVKRCSTRVNTCSVTRQPKAENGCEAIREYLPRILRQILTLEQVSALSGSQPVVVNDIMQWFACIRFDGRVCFQ